MDHDTARAAIEAHRDRIASIPNVHAFEMGPKLSGGADTGKTAIVVHVDRKRHVEDLHPDHRLPDSIDGVVTDVVESKPHILTMWRQRERPICCGLPISRMFGPIIGSGTIAAVVKLGDGDPNRYLLTAGHVIGGERDENGNRLWTPTDEFFHQPVADFWTNCVGVRHFEDFVTNTKIDAGLIRLIECEGKNYVWTFGDLTGIGSARRVKQSSFSDTEMMTKAERVGIHGISSGQYYARVVSDTWNHKVSGIWTYDMLKLSIEPDYRSLSSGGASTEPRKGDSGAPVLNEKFELIGVVSSWDPANEIISATKATNIVETYGMSLA